MRVRQGDVIFELVPEGEVVRFADYTPVPRMELGRFASLRASGAGIVFAVGEHKGMAHALLDPATREPTKTGDALFLESLVDNQDRILHLPKAAVVSVGDQSTHRDQLLAPGNYRVRTQVEPPMPATQSPAPVPRAYYD